MFEGDQKLNSEGFRSSVILAEIRQMQSEIRKTGSFEREQRELAIRLLNETTRLQRRYRNSELVHYLTLAIERDFNDYLTSGNMEKAMLEIEGECNLYQLLKP